MELQMVSQISLRDLGLLSLDLTPKKASALTTIALAALAAEKLIIEKTLRPKYALPLIASACVCAAVCLREDTSITKSLTLASEERVALEAKITSLERINGSLVEISKKFATLSETRKRSSDEVISKLEQLQKLAEFLEPLARSITHNTMKMEEATKHMAELVTQHRAETAKQAQLVERNAALLEKLTELSATIKGGK
jgi:hypothetical protein